MISDSTLRPVVHLGLGWIDDRGGGLERYQDGICRAHDGLGVSTTAFVQSRIPIAGEHGYRAIAFASLDDSRKTRFAKLRESLSTNLNDRSDAVFVSHHASVSYPVLDLVAKRQHVVHFQGPWADEAAVEGAAWWKTSLQRRQERRVYRSADRIITLSTAFKELVVNRYAVDAGDVHVIPGGIDSTAADPVVSRAEARGRFNWPLDRPILLSIRRLCRRVGIDVLIESASEIVRKHPDVLIMIGGTGPLAGELQDRIDAGDLCRNVRLLGFVPDEDLSLAYRAADYSVVPTQSLEGFGLVTLESMATGTPALVTPIGSLPEVMSPLSSSLIFEGASSGQIADGVDQILSGSVQTPDDETCKRYVRENFDWSVIAPKVLAVYQGRAVTETGQWSL